jgi:hypothetical protein
MKIWMILAPVLLLVSCNDDKTYQNRSKAASSGDGSDGAVSMSFELPSEADYGGANLTHYSVQTTPVDCDYSEEGRTTKAMATTGGASIYPNCKQEIRITLGLLDSSDSGDATTPPPESGDSPKTPKKFPVTYNDNIKSYVDMNCATAGCHRAGGQSPALTNYAEVKAAATASNSRIQAGTMPQGSPASAAQKEMFQQWVTDGTPEANPTAFKLDGAAEFASTIKPILQKSKCLDSGCHHEGSPYGGMTTADDFLKNDKELGMASVTRMEMSQTEAGFMPRNGDRVSADDLAAFKAWLDGESSDGGGGGSTSPSVTLPKHDPLTTEYYQVTFTVEASDLDGSTYAAPNLVFKATSAATAESYPETLSKGE